jgi:cytokinin dehydrogenase
MTHDAATGALSRRHLVKTLGAGLGVLGLNAATGAWIASAQAHTRVPFLGVPPLDGTLHLDEANCTAYAQDFGSIVHEQPVAVLKPGSVGDIARMVGFARRHGIRVAGRGRAHTTFGQAQVQAGVVIDISTLQTVHLMSDELVEVDAGMRWNTLLGLTLARGRMPPALTDYIGQTVGGTLSVGGIGGMTQRQGAQVDNVLELQVVTGEGERLTCSPTQRRALFDAVLAGQGQVAAIVRATLRLVPAPARIRVFNLVYLQLSTLTADMQRLMDEQRFEFMEAFGFLNADGSWTYLLQAGSYYTPPAEPDADALLAGLQDHRAAMSIDDQGLSEFANRVPVDMPVQPHPWIDLILPAATVDVFVGTVEQTLRPLVAGDSFTILLIPMQTRLFTRPLFRAPKTKFAFGFGILRYLPADPGAVEQALSYNRSLFDRCRDLGGTHYPISAVRLERDDWVRHYGPALGPLVAAKARFDPDRVFASGPDFL